PPPPVRSGGEWSSRGEYPRMPWNRAGCDGPRRRMTPDDDELPCEEGRARSRGRSDRRRGIISGRECATMYTKSIPQRTEVQQARGYVYNSGMRASERAY